MKTVIDQKNLYSKLAIKVALENGREALALQQLPVEPVIDEIRRIEDEIVEELLNNLKLKVVRVAKTPTLPYTVIELKEGIALASRYDTYMYAIEEIYTDNNELKELIELIQKDPAINYKITTKIIKTHNIEEHTPEIIEEDDKKEEWREVKTYIHDDHPCGVFLREIKPLYGKIKKIVKVRHSGPETTTIITILAKPNTLVKLVERVAECPDGYYDVEKIVFIGAAKKVVKKRVISSDP